MNRVIAVAAAAVAVAVMLATYLFSTMNASDDRFAQCRAGSVAGGGALGGPFELVNGSGQTVTDKDVITEPALIYFGYTYCPDVCPMDVDRNAAAVDILEERGQSVVPVFISIDPARDTPEVVADFAANMHPRMIGLTGSADQVKAASTAYRTYFNAHEPVDSDYLVDHSTFSYLVLPETGFAEFFRRDMTPDAVADRVGCFLDAI